MFIHTGEEITCGNNDEEHDDLTGESTPTSLLSSSEPSQGTQSAGKMMLKNQKSFPCFFSLSSM